MHRRDAGAAQARLEPEIEVRRVHPYEHVRRIRDPGAGKAGAHRQEGEVARHRLDQSGNGQAIHRIEATAPRLDHAGTRNALETGMRNPLPERADEPRAQPVARRLPCDQGYAHRRFSRG